MSVGLVLAMTVFRLANAAGPAEKAPPPDPLGLLQHVAKARQQIASAELEFEVAHYEFSRPLDGTNHLKLKAVFDGGKRRFESFDREYAYVLMGPDAANVTDAKRQELRLDREAAIRAGLLTGFDAHYVTTYDGECLLRYREVEGRPEGATIEDPVKGSFTYVFDPRTFGISSILSVGDTVERCLWYQEAKEILLVGKELVDDIAAWHVRAVQKVAVDKAQTTFRDWAMDFWIAVDHPARVLKVEDRGRGITVKATFAEGGVHDPLPTELRVTHHRNGMPLRVQQLALRKAGFNVPVDPVSWTLVGLKMVVGTPVVDVRIHRRLGYWNGAGLSDSPPREASDTRKPGAVPKPDELLSLMEKDPKSPFALEAAMWIILNTPDGREVEKAAEVIRRDHLRSPSLAYLCAEAGRMHHRCTKELLRALLDSNPHHQIQAYACFALAALLKGQADDVADEPAAAEAERLFERVAVDFGPMELEGAKLTDLAKSELSELRRLRVGKVAPEIEGEDLNGRSMKLSDFRGKVVVLTFWGTWCGACMEMVPDERKLVERLAGKPFALVGINSDSNLAKVKAVVEREKMTWRSFRDGEGKGTISQAWNVHSWPAVYVIDPKGVIRYRNLRGPDLAAAVDALLREYAEQHR